MKTNCKWKTLFFTVFAIAAIFAVMTAFKMGKSGNEAQEVVSRDRASYFCIYPKLHNGDAKFLGEDIITSLDGCFTVIQKDGIITKHSDIKTNWLDCIPGEKIIVYANFQNQMGVLSLDDYNNIVENNILAENDDLFIDPAVIKADDQYYVTFTQIKGNVNNADVNAENGEYILRLYKSKDLKELEFLGNLVDEHSNIEDVELFYDGQDLYAVYEKETVDKGDSSVEIKKFDKNGKICKGGYSSRQTVIMSLHHFHELMMAIYFITVVIKILAVIRIWVQMHFMHFTTMSLSLYPQITK